MKENKHSLKISRSCGDITTPWSEAKELKEKLRIKLKRVLLNV